MLSVQVEPQARWILEAHCDERYPYEVGGAILGKIIDGHPLVEDIFPISNASNSPSNTYQESQGWDAVSRFYAKAHGLEVLGNFHSHPNGSIPSEQDMKAYVGVLGLWIMHHGNGKHTFASSKNIEHLEVELLGEPASEVRHLQFRGDTINLGDLRVSLEGRLEGDERSFSLMKLNEKTRKALIYAHQSIDNYGEFELNGVASKLGVTRSTLRGYLKSAGAIVDLNFRFGRGRGKFREGWK